MGAPAFTRADYDLLPEGFPAWLCQGELIRDETPTYGHFSVVPDEVFAPPRTSETEGI
jgi:hypothetical protein